MTEILSLLAKSYSKPSARNNDENDSQQQTPNKNSPQKSHYLRKQISEQNLVCSQSSNHTLKVHKSIAEDLFKGYPVYQKKSDVSPFRQRLNYHNQTVKQLKYAPQKQIKTQVQKYIEIKGQSIPSNQTPSDENGLVKVGKLGMTDQLPMQNDDNETQVYEKKQGDPKVKNIQKNQSKPLINLQKIPNHPTEAQPINSQYESQNYQSSNHYRSRSQSALKTLDLQSTQWLLDHKPIYQKQRQASISSNKQSSPNKTIVDESRDKLNSSTTQQNSTDNDSMSMSQQSSKHSFKPTQQTNGQRALKSLSQIRTQRKLEKDKKNSPRTSLTQTQFLTIKESIYEERQSDAFLKHEQFVKQSLSITPILENHNQRESWITSQIQKEKAKLGKDYTQYLINKYQKR